jgi:opacity protein-like surface antigen
MVAVAVMATVPPSAASAESFYAAVRGGPGVTPDNFSGRPGSEDRDEYKTGFTGGAALGYVLPFGLRVEGEFGFLHAPLDREGGVEVDGSVKSYLLMANAYYDFTLPFLGPFRPYVGFGLGGARVHYDHEVFLSSVGAKIRIDDTRTALAYQVRGGIRYDVSRRLDLSLGYRYAHIDSGHEDDGPARINLGRIENHALELGVAIKF